LLLADALLRGDSLSDTLLLAGASNIYSKYWTYNLARRSHLIIATYC
jgi:hypothetical protein